MESMVTIPGRTSLRFSGAQMTLVDNARYEPEQVLLLTSSSPVAEKAPARQSVALPAAGAPSEATARRTRIPTTGSDESQVGKRHPRAKSQHLEHHLRALRRARRTTHGFKFLAPVGRYLYVSVPDGVQGIGGYISGKPYAATIVVEPVQAGADFPRPGRAAVARRATRRSAS